MTENSGNATPGFDPEQILSTLNTHGVRYVVIGALAALAHGAPIGATYDVDVTPSRDGENLERLSQALSNLDAHIRTADSADGLLFAH